MMERRDLRRGIKRVNGMVVGGKLYRWTMRELVER